MAASEEAGPSVATILARRSRLIACRLPAGADGDAKGGRCVADGERDGSGRTGFCSALSVSCTVQERCSLVSTSKKPVRS